MKNSSNHSVLLKWGVNKALTLKLSAYLAGFLPSQITPSIHLLVRITSFGTLTFEAVAACL